MSDENTTVSHPDRGKAKKKSVLSPAYRHAVPRHALPAVVQVGHAKEHGARQDDGRVAGRAVVRVQEGKHAGSKDHLLVMLCTCVRVRVGVWVDDFAG